MPDVHLVVIAKAPVPGRVKTRLCPPLDHAAAAAVAAAALTDTLDVVTGTPAAARTLALDGDATGWSRDGIVVMPQRGAGLDERLAAALDDAYARHPAPLLLVGMDTPQLSPQLLMQAADTLTSVEVDAVLGPATDGGFWAIGLRRPDASALVGVPMSMAMTARVQRDRLDARGLRVATLASLTDVDDIVTARRVAALAPGSAFARALAAVRAAA